MISRADSSPLGTHVCRNRREPRGKPARNRRRTGGDPAQNRRQADARAAQGGPTPAQERRQTGRIGLRACVPMICAAESSRPSTRCNPRLDAASAMGLADSRLHGTQAQGPTRTTQPQGLAVQRRDPPPSSRRLLHRGDTHCAARRRHRGRLDHGAARDRAMFRRASVPARDQINAGPIRDQVPPSNPIVPTVHVTDQRSGKEIAESFMKSRISNPLIRARSHSEDRNH